MARLTAADYVISYKTDPEYPAATVADLFKVDGSTVKTNVAIRDLKPVWTAGARLSALNNNLIPTQRSYTAITATGRYIRTWVDTNKNGRVGCRRGDRISFTAANFPSSMRRVTIACSQGATVGTRQHKWQASHQHRQLHSAAKKLPTCAIATIDRGDGLGALTRPPRRYRALRTARGRARPRKATT